MFDANFTIATEAHETNAQVMSVIIGRAIRRLKYLHLLDALDADDRKLMFELKCSQQLIEDVCCLECFIERIGKDQFKGMVTSLWGVGWGTEDAFLMAYLANLARYFEIADDDDITENVETSDLTEYKAHMLH